MKVAASPQSINRAMPEGGIQVTSHQSLVTPNPQSLIPSYSSLLSNFRVQGSGFRVVVAASLQYIWGDARMWYSSHQSLVT